jgi:hypothetical protein
MAEQDIRPIPDPTVLTTAASVRLEEMIRDLIKAEIMHQHDLFSEKLARIDMQFNMLDARTAEQKSDTKAALDAALAAQKEAVASQTASFKENITKSETAATERIKGVETLLATSSKSTDDKISDLKDRIIAIEATKLGSTEQAATTRAGGSDLRSSMASIISVITTLIAVASIIVTIIVVTRP